MKIPNESTMKCNFFSHKSCPQEDVYGNTSHSPAFTLVLNTSGVELKETVRPLLQLYTYLEHLFECSGNLLIFRVLEGTCRIFRRLSSC